jgi:hypothetical protein
MPGVAAQTRGAGSDPRETGDEFGGRNGVCPSAERPEGAIMAWFANR